MRQLRQNAGISHRRILTRLLILGIAILCGWATQVSAALSLDFEYIGALNLTHGSQAALRPVAVTLDPTSGEICVTEARAPAFHVFNDLGIETFRTGRMAGLSSPRDASLDADGNFVFTDLPPEGGFATIRRLSPFGEPGRFELSPPDTVWAPRFLTIMRDGTYLSLDINRGIMSKHAPDTGRLLWSCQIGGEDAQELHLGRPIEAADGRIYVPGGELHKVLVLTADGELVEEFGKFGTGPGRLVFPVGIANGPGGTVLVLDRMRHKVLAYDQDHEFLSEFGSIGARPGQFYHPVSITSREDGRIYVAQGYLGRVQVFRVSRRDSEH